MVRVKCEQLQCLKTTVQCRQLIKKRESNSPENLSSEDKKKQAVLEIFRKTYEITHEE